ncbi:hypothetical protein EMIHUDRAFT_231866 [Emiliania huxleyi CCMP1516]|uniref:Uncharacterized protein n=2 Tax=Emiliania huxleyi TaxID=2903 RepID=A0A0D3K6T6_EMIH1|nr:hypothetical protein EMIHUDRAFT_231866 [Emiliania huxleyi CCMP1516]EOD31471.1 hypothetical protein EMIHUDRAFT_231866 [Emiliania huxleyi CCMP1516]|eukprot:XP_005783900.1 hypothetical protein EMIHUDRAFT_231866 [Emiliania huxleyi CCMP1516]
MEPSNVNGSRRGVGLVRKWTRRRWSSSAALPGDIEDQRDLSGISELDRRRAVLPSLPWEEAFISVEELKRLYDKGNFEGRLPIISISFCWDTAAHPDPRGKQLATVAATLEREMPKYAEEMVSHDFNTNVPGFTEMGVFWDWGCLHQRDPALFDPTETPEAKPEGPEREAFVVDLQAKRRFYGGAAYEASRSEEENAAFRYALHNTMDLWYAHQGTGTQRKAGYDESGWTTYERCSAEQIKKAYSMIMTWSLVLDLGASSGEALETDGLKDLETCDEESRANNDSDEVSDEEDEVETSCRAAEPTRRRWPLDPDGFDELIEKKQFTNGADKGAVKALYRKMSEGQLSSVKELNFQRMTKPTVRDMQQLGRCLSLCRRLRYCDLPEVGLTDEAGAALFSNIATDAHIEEMRLWKNQLGPAAAEAIAAYLRSNRSMTKLRIEGNPIEDKGERVIYEAVRDKEDFLLGTDGMGEQFETSSESET